MSAHDARDRIVARNLDRRRAGRTVGDAVQQDLRVGVDVRDRVAGKPMRSRLGPWPAKPMAGALTSRRVVRHAAMRVRKQPHCSAAGLRRLPPLIRAVCERQTSEARARPRHHRCCRQPTATGSYELRVIHGVDRVVGMRSKPRIQACGFPDKLTPAAQTLHHKDVGGRNEVLQIRRSLRRAYALTVQIPLARGGAMRKTMKRTHGLARGGCACVPSDVSAVGRSLKGADGIF